MDTQKVKYILTITAEKIESTDSRFTMENLTLGDQYQPLEVYYQRADGEKIHRKRNKGEIRISNQTMPRLIFQIFEKDIASLSEEQKKAFPVCKYSPNHQEIRGIFPNEVEYKKYRNSFEHTILYLNQGRNM